MSRINASNLVIKEKSEKCFEDYLNNHGYEYIKDYKLKGGKEIDFLVQGKNIYVYCDVKAILVSKDNSTNMNVAIKRLRKDLSELRKKFNLSKPDFPLILVSMNFSNESITGFTYARAMYGEMTFGLKPLHHMEKGNAAMTIKHNTGISGILGFNYENTIESYLFHNQFAENPIPPKFFPSTIDVINSRDSTRTNLELLGGTLIQPYIRRLSE